MKGNSACQKFLLRKDPLEGLLLETIQGRLERLLAGEGENLLHRCIEEEIAAQGADPRREATTLLARIAEIDAEEASVLLESISPDTKDFIDGKLRELATEKRRLTHRLEELESKPVEPIDADAVLKRGLTAIRDLPRLLDSGNLEERKEFVRAFVAGITVVPDKLRIDLQMRTLPAVLGPDFTCEMVAGGRYEPLQMDLEPAERFVAGGKRARFVA